MSKRHFALALPMHLIQALRLAHALMEVDTTIHISTRHAPKFEYLRTFFDLEFEIGEERWPVLAGASVSHDEPLTRVGAIERPLIFPHAIVERCRTKWRSARPVRFSFCGLVDQKRRATLDAWSRAHSEARVEVFPSERGRKFPEKVWDESYYERLARSEFVLCPRGDCVWSYRFFEAILCGAIPIAEQACPAFQGFEYALLTDDVSGLEWSAEVAGRNFAQAVQRLTVSCEELNAELAGPAVLDGRRNDWHQVREALREAAGTITRERSLIVIDQDAWRVDELDLGVRTRPFLEHGTPSDDASAIHELDKLRAQGADAVALASSSFWWLEFYPDFAAHLRAASRRVVESDRLKFFALK